MKGILISFDGLDSSGKATQVHRLAKNLRKIGWNVHDFETPDYSTPSGHMLKQRLQNKSGEWDETPWEEKLRYFSENRKEHKEEVIQALKNGEIVIYDRYVPSSMTFIVMEALEANSTKEQRGHIYAMVEKEEYNNNGMPKEDISIFLDVPPHIALELLKERKEKLYEDDEYTDRISVQERLYEEYQQLFTADKECCVQIQCVNKGKLQSVDDIAIRIQEELDKRFPFLYKRK